MQKGKLTDYLLSTDKFDITARAQGGHNAGHSVKTGGQSYSFHLLPTGLVSPKTDNLIGSGVVFNIEAFFSELADLEAKGVPRVHERIHVSNRCHINLLLHAVVDGVGEQELGSKQIGTTKRGIGPAYSTKAARDGIRIVDLFNGSFEAKLRKLEGGYKKRYGDLLQYSVEDEIKYMNGVKDKLFPYCLDAIDYVKSVRDQKKRILVESSQALGTRECWSSC